MTEEQMIDRYNELSALYKHESYVVTNEEHQEYLELCSELLYIIMKENADVLIRLKNRA